VIRGGTAVTALLPALLSCSSPSEPVSGITLLVTNGTCRFGLCDTVRALGFPEHQPLTPAGYWSIDLGLVAGPSACLTLPPSAEFHVIAMPEADTTTFTWTGDDSLSLGGQLAGTPILWAAPSTTAFVPASAQGWSVTLPGGSAAFPVHGCSP